MPQRRTRAHASLLAMPPGAHASTPHSCGTPAASAAATAGSAPPLVTLPAGLLESDAMRSRVSAALERAAGVVAAQ